MWREMKITSVYSVISTLALIPIVLFVFHSLAFIKTLNANIEKPKIPALTNVDLMFIQDICVSSDFGDECATECLFALQELNVDQYGNCRKPSVSLPKTDCGDFYSGTIKIRTCGYANSLVSGGVIYSFCGYNGIVRNINRCTFFKENPSPIMNMDLIVSDDKDALQKTEKFVGFVEKLSKALSDTKTFEAIKGIMTSLSSFMSVIGPIFSIVSLFLPKGEDPVMKKLGEIDSKLTRIEDKIDNIGKVIHDALFQNEVLIRLADYRLLLRELGDFQHDPSSETYKINIKEVCGPNNAAVRLISWYYINMVEQTNRDNFWNMVNAQRVKWSTTKFNAFYGTVIRHVLEASFVEAKCFSYFHWAHGVNVTKEEIERNIAQTREMTDLIVEYLDINRRTVKSDGIKIEMMNEVENQLRLGGSYEQKASNVFQSIKNLWGNEFYFLVFVYQDVSGYDNHGMTTNCFGCGGYYSAGAIWKFRTNEVNVHIQYTSRFYQLDLHDLCSTARGSAPAWDSDEWSTVMRERLGTPSFGYFNANGNVIRQGNLFTLMVGSCGADTRYRRYYIMMTGSDMLQNMANNNETISTAIESFSF